MKMKMKHVSIALTPCQRLASIKKEWHTRQRKGKHICYIITDKYSRFILLGQTLPHLAFFINSTIIQNDPCFNVSVSGLYQLLDCQTGKVNGYHKSRWRIIRCGIEDAVNTYNSMRWGYENSVVVGCHQCYSITDHAPVSQMHIVRAAIK